MYESFKNARIYTFFLPNEQKIPPKECFYHVFLFDY